MDVGILVHLSFFGACNPFIAFTLLFDKDTSTLIDYEQKSIKGDKVSMKWAI
jgi:hypothetical protein